MNSDMRLFLKGLAEADKILIDKDTKYNFSKEQKEILKQLIDQIYKDIDKK